MDIFDDSDNITDTFIYFPIITNQLVSSSATTITTNLTLEISDKDWMPYRFFEYDPLYHKKYARYKIQMENMWD